MVALSYLAFFCALAVILVLAFELRHANDREAANYRKMFDLILADRDEAREEADAIRIAAFPALGRIKAKTDETKAVKPQPDAPVSPVRPLTHDEQIAAIWRNPRMSTRDKLAAVTRLCNTKQRRRDEMVEQIEKVQAVASEVTSEVRSESTEENPPHVANQKAG